MSTMAPRKRSTATWKKIFEPNRWPSFAPSMTKADTPSEYMTTAVPTVVGGVLKLSTMPRMETGRADTLNDISIWPKAMTIIGTHDSCGSGAGDAAFRTLIAWCPFESGAWGSLVTRARPVRSHLRLGDEEIHAELLGEELGHELALHAVAGLIEGRSERPQPAL